MPYAWIAFYEDHQFIREGVVGTPPATLPGAAGKSEARLTSVQLYDHSGRAFIEQTFDGYQWPIVSTISVPSPERAGTVACHILGWQETVHDEAGLLRNVQHLAHIVEDGRVIMTSGPAPVQVFTRPRRRLHPDTWPHTWVAIYDHLDAGPALYQFNPATGIEVSGEHIDRRRLRSLILTDGNGDPWIEQIYEAGQRVIYRRRVEQPHGVCGFDPIVVFLLGWQVTARDADGNPINIQHVSYTFRESGITIMSGPFDEAHEVFHGMEPVPTDSLLVGVGGPHPLAGVGRE
jgi:hypothetical protein